MNSKLIYSIVFLILSGAADGFRDTLMFHYSETGFPDGHTFFDPDTSWRGKWKNGAPDQGEAFPGSSTIFVWATDAWHLCQTIMLASWRIIVLIAFSFYIRAKWWQWGLLFFVISAVWSGGFHLVYSLIF